MKSGIFALALLFCFLGNARSSPNFPLKSSQQGDRMVIVDSDDERVKFACVNWYGFHIAEMVVNGLDRQPLDRIADHIKEMGFNCVRLVYAIDTLYATDPVPEWRLTENPDLVGLTPIEIYDKVVDALTTREVMVILNNHVSSAHWCCHYDDGEGLWYTDKYPEEAFFNHWTEMAGRYVGNPWVVGADLRNEIRGVLNDNHTILASWGLGNPKTDWNKAAEEAGKRVLEVNPDLLVIVEGLASGGILSGAAVAPVVIPNQEKLVYSAHMYTNSPVIPDLPYDLFVEAMYLTQTFVTKPGHAYSAPFWFGETGTELDTEKWEKIYSWLKENDLDWGYWSLDGYMYSGQTDEHYGIFLDDYETIRHPWKLQQLQEIMPILSP